MKTETAYRQLTIDVGVIPSVFAAALSRGKISLEHALEHCAGADGPPLDAHRDPSRAGRYLCCTCQRRHDEENNPLTGRWGDE